jgi:hypothetical protein
MRKLALQALIASIAASALLGIYVLLFGTGGEWEGKILSTALSTCVLSILVMACGAALERGRLGALPHAGMAASLAGYVLLVAVFWELVESSRWPRAGLSFGILGAAAALACLISLASLPARWTWVRWLGHVSAAAVSVLLLLFIWEVLGTDDEWASRWLGVLAIVLGAVTITVPILHRMSGHEASPGPVAGLSVRHCVACGAGLDGAPGDDLECPGCGVRFRVEPAEPA